MFFTPACDVYTQNSVNRVYCVVYAVDMNVCIHNMSVGSYALILNVGAKRPSLYGHASSNMYWILDLTD